MTNPNIDPQNDKVTTEKFDTPPAAFAKPGNDAAEKSAAAGAGDAGAVRPAAFRGLFAKAALSEKNVLFAMLISIICGAATVLLSLFPVSVEIRQNVRVIYNLLGVINQQIGGAYTLEDAFSLLLLYFTGMALMAVGCISACYRLKTSMLFTVAASVLFIIFASSWLGTESMESDPASLAFAHSAIPFLFLFFASCTLIAALAALFLFLSGKLQKPLQLRKPKQTGGSSNRHRKR